MPVITDIADAIVAELNGTLFVPSVTAERHYVPQFELTEMQALHVTVVPRSAAFGMADRTRSQSDYSIDIAVQQKLQAGDNAEVDPLLGLVEQIADHFRGRRLDSYPAAAWLRTEQTVLYAPEHMHELRQFTSVLTLTYRVHR